MSTFSPFFYHDQMIYRVQQLHVIAIRNDLKMFGVRQSGIINVFQNIYIKICFRKIILSKVQVNYSFLNSKKTQQIGI